MPSSFVPFPIRAIVSKIADGNSLPVQTPALFFLGYALEKPFSMILDTFYGSWIRLGYVLDTSWICMVNLGYVLDTANLGYVLDTYVLYKNTAGTNKSSKPRDDEYPRFLNMLIGRPVIYGTLLLLPTVVRCPLTCRTVSLTR